MKRIVFCGFRGTGKTDIGKIVAEKTGLPVLDTDILIEQRTGRSIPDTICNGCACIFHNAC